MEIGIRLHQSSRIEIDDDELAGNGPQVEVNG